MAGARNLDPARLETEVRELASFDGGQFLVVTLNLDTDGRRLPRKRDLEAQVGVLVKQARAQADAFAPSHAAQRALEADLERISRFVSERFDRKDTRGLAIFACEGRTLWHVFELPLSLRTRIVVDRHPHVLPLESLLAGAGTTATVLVDRSRARIFTTRLGVTVERTDVFDEVPGRHDQGGWSQARYQRHVEDHVHRHLQHAAEVLFALSKRERIDRIVLAGPDPVLAEFEKGLHTWLTERVVGRITLPMRAGVARVRAATLEIEERLEQERVRDVVARLREELEASRLAVAGLAPTVDAVQQGRAEVVVVSDGEARPGWRCRACGALSLREGSCPACGGDLSAVPSVIEELVDLAMRRRCQIVSSDKVPVEIGALLRF